MDKNMIYIVTALYAEAHAFITRFQLKKDISHTHFQVFLNKDANLCLIISGTGSVPVAVALSSICTEFGARQGDFLLNAGVCAQVQNRNIPSASHCLTRPCLAEHIRPAENACPAKNTHRTGQIFLCSKIIEQATGKTFYPDILYRHKFPEAQIITGAKPYDGGTPMEIGCTDFCLYDMEAAAVYQAGAYYFAPHQMSFLKIISDDGNIENVTPKLITAQIEKNMEDIAEYITSLQNISLNMHSDEIFPESAAQKKLEQLCMDMHCSKTMSESLCQYIRYCILADIDYASVLEEMYESGKLPCKDKREGKQCFEELKERLL